MPSPLSPPSPPSGASTSAAGSDSCPVGSAGISASSYTLVVVGGVAALEARPAVWKTILLLSLGGAGIAAYHVVLQVTPSAGGSCEIGGGCTAIQYPMFGGLLTIPRLSLVAFLLVTVLALVLVHVTRSESANR